MADPAPYVSKELVEYLERTVPDRCPSPSDSDRDIWMQVGAVRLVRRLRQLHTKQTENR